MQTWINNIKNLYSKIKYLINNYYFNNRYYDLTQPITKETPVFPGDPEFKVEKIESIENGNSYNLCYLHLNNHMGTHIDFPAHVIADGKTSSDYPIDYLVGPGVVIHVPEEINSDLMQNITSELIKSQPIKKQDIVFFKTCNTLFSTKNPHNNISISMTAAEELIKKEVKIVGIDNLSVDKFSESNLPIHNLLLRNNILIVENLNLKQIPAGRYSRIFVIPPNIPEMDGLPVRSFVYH